MKCASATEFCYHSVSEKSVVGLAEVSKEAFLDPTGENWLAVEIAPVEKFEKDVPLDRIKAEESLRNIALLKQSRLSVMPLSAEEFETILRMTED